MRPALTDSTITVGNQNGRCRESAWAVSGISMGGVRNQHGRCQNQHCSVLDLVDSFGS